MASRDDKKTLYILLAVLGVAVVGGGIWLYQILKPADIVTSSFDIESDPQVNKVFAIKQTATKNVIDFIGSRTSSDTILDKIYNDPQYQALEDFEVVIDLEEGIGNPEPFIPQVSEDDEEGEDLEL
ncbi:hypothetical protein C0580_01600 [Candidatus Parcubacteria bacterium]|nr:MAG: hypothetical protein C0580_01600 [Candidatus Parcubacteria bacterium]